jgi:hypothetical protein
MMSSEIRTRGSPVRGWPLAGRVGRDRVWPSLIVASAALACMLYATGQSSTLRAAVTLWFLLVCPGMAVVRYLDLPSWWVEILFAVAVSLVLAEAVTMALMYGGSWSAGRGLVVLSAMAVVLVIVHDILPFGRAMRAMSAAGGKHVA